MLNPTYPGIYLREAESGVRTIVGVPTAIAAFVGPTKSGIDLRPKRILNFGEFERAYGGLESSSELSYGVLHFFQNGGGEAVIVRVANAASQKAAIAARNATPAVALTIEALSSGPAGNRLYVEIESTGKAADRRFGLSIVDALTGTQESFSDLSMDSSSLRYAPAIVNDPDLGSQLVSITAVAGADAPLPTGTTFAATQPAANTFGSNAARAYSFKASIKRIVGGILDSYLPETEIPLIAQNAKLPLSWTDFGKQVAAAINGQIGANPIPMRVESALLEFRDGNGVVTDRQLRFRIRSSDPANDASPDAVIDIKRTSAQNDIFALLGLTATEVNASRYALGFDYAPDNRVEARNRVVGTNAGLPSAADIKAGIRALDKTTFNLLCIPDAVRPVAGNPATPQYDWQDIYTVAVELCEARRAFLLLDPPPHVDSIAKAEAWKSNELTVRTPHGATYFPRLKMSDPLQPGSLRAYPPSGAMAGVIARTDANRGVWKSPAGVDAALAGVYAPSVLMSDEEHGLLNPLGVNCLRKFPIYGSVSYGARTLVGSDAEADQWKYLAVRRTASYILLSLQRGLTWVTFQPNDEPLWGQIRMNVTTFMQGLFRQGAFQGRSPREAYLVKCDAETTLQADIDQGIVNVVVGFAPLKPAEFVFVTLRQLAGQSQT